MAVASQALKWPGEMVLELSPVDRPLVDHSGRKEGGCTCVPIRRQVCALPRSGQAERRRPEEEVCGRNIERVRGIEEPLKLRRRIGLN
jgi:hypothetical protein